MSDGKGEHQVWGAAVTSGTPVVIQLSSSGSMGVGRPQDQKGVASTPTISATSLFTPLRFGVTPYQLTDEITLGKNILELECCTKYHYNCY